MLTNDELVLYITDFITLCPNQIYLIHCQVRRETPGSAGAVLREKGDRI